MRRGDASGRTGLAGLALCAALGASGCADLTRATSLAPDRTTADSPVAAQVEAASRADLRRPRFRDIPPAPVDVRAAAGWRGSVTQSVQAREAVTAWLSANPPTLTGDDTEAFAQGGRASIPASERQAAPVDPAGTEDFAARLRAQAAPPAPPK